MTSRSNRTTEQQEQNNRSSSSNSNSRAATEQQQEQQQGSTRAGASKPEQCKSTALTISRTRNNKTTIPRSSYVQD
jgi:hypothetical protein